MANLVSEILIMSTAQKKQELIDFLLSIQRPDYPYDSIDETSSLVESGLIDRWRCYRS